MRFLFDPAKDKANLIKHGLSLSDAYRVYYAVHKLTLLSPRKEEQRKMDIALVEIAGVVLVLVYVQRSDDEIRAISLRRASKQERRLYGDWQEKNNVYSN